MAEKPTYDERLADLIRNSDSAVHQAILEITTDKPSDAKSPAKK